MSRTRWGAVVLALVAAATPAPAKNTPLPYRVVIASSWGDGAGSDTFRMDLQRAVADAFGRGCFTEVVVVDDDPANAAGDLLLAIYLSDAIEEIRFDDTIAGALMPGEPAKELRREAFFQVSVDARLTSRADLAPVEGKAFVAAIARRPMVLGEDPQASARQLAIERIVSDLSKTFCRNADKLARKIKAAMPAETTPPR
jgi:hypothetical protein